MLPAVWPTQSEIDLIKYEEGTILIIINNSNQTKNLVPLEGITTHKVTEVISNRTITTTIDIYDICILIC